MKRIISLVLAMVTAIAAKAQEVEMADTMRSEGKIYVVVAIVLVVLIGLIAFLVLTDRKVTNLENRLKN